MFVIAGPVDTRSTPQARITAKRLSRPGFRRTLQDEMPKNMETGTMRLGRPSVLLDSMDGFL